MFRDALVASWYLLLLAPVCNPMAIAQQVDPGSHARRLTSYERQKGVAFADSTRARYEDEARKQKPNAITQVRGNAEFEKRIHALELESAKLLAELTQVESEADTLRKATAKREERARLEIDFEKDEALVRHMLGALFAAGYTQPVPGAKHKLTTTLGPVSLSALREFGALDPTEKGMLQLGHAGSDPTNDRGPYGFPKRVGGELDRPELEFLLPAQKLLIKYQELLVEKRWLAP